MVGMTDSLRPRQRLGLACSLVSVLCAAFAPLPLLGLLFSTEFASDFENGTHLADHSGVPVAEALAIAAILFALIGVAIGTTAARVVGGLVLAAPTLLLLHSVQG